MADTRPKWHCRFFAVGRCNFGGNCKFLHDDNKVARMPLSTRELLEWQARLNNKRPLQLETESFFRDARRLTDSDAASRQDIVNDLAAAKGIEKIKELLSLPWPHYDDATLFRRYNSCLSPFIQVVTDNRILSSGILEACIGTIYNFMFGFGGERGEILIDTVLRALQNRARFLVGDSTYATVQIDDADDDHNLAALCTAFHLLVRCNQTAKLNPAYGRLFEDINDFVDVIQRGVSPRQLEKCRKSLHEASIYLDDGMRFHSRDGLSKPVSSSTTRPVFKIQRAGPGKHDSGDPRHDNDHEDIKDIQVLPTYDEIASDLPEYLPLLDPETWHKEGLPGLLDRHFRLLREDAIGPLRDRIRMELVQRDPSNQGAEQTAFERRWVFEHVEIEYPFFDPKMGLEVVVSFDQPRFLRGLNVSQRQSLWENSRHLSHDSVVCILTTQRRLIFCHVVGDFDDKTSRRYDDENDNVRTRKGPVSLYQDAKRGTLLVRPVNPDAVSFRDLIYLYNFGASLGNATLLDFPGVLLPAFMPTLKALKDISLSNALPFPQYLMPSASSATGSEVMQPPAYTAGRGFRFDLDAICDRDSGMSFDPAHPSTKDAAALSESSALDPSQAQTVIEALSRRLALLQGPPGTGKSFVGVHLVRVLAALKSRLDLGPIVCVCYTNHALDQLLEHLLDAKVTQIIRIGSASKSKRIQQLNLRDIARLEEKTKFERTHSYRCAKFMDVHARDINAGLRRMVNSSIADQLKTYLEKRNQSQAAQLFPSGPEIDDMGFETVRHVRTNLTRRLGEWLRGGTLEPHAHRGVEETQHMALCSLTNPERHDLYHFWLDTIVDQQMWTIESSLEEFVGRKDSLNLVREEVNLRVLEQANVIGLTTSGLARNLPLMRNLNVKVLLCEEAGEVLESHLLTALLPSVEHAILIGDHLQLRPHVQYSLSRESSEGGKFSLDLSLFERLVAKDGELGGCGLPCSSLLVQRRMHPEIAALVRVTLYPNLIDDPPARIREPILGLRRRLFWLDHENSEAENNGTEGMRMSHTNDFEVETIAALTSHIVKQGQFYPQDIAVITPYLGQLRKLRTRLGRLFELAMDERDEEELFNAGLLGVDAASGAYATPLSSAVRIATIDNFQGEEAKVIIVSLVRSNERRQCGFLKTTNRINVLLSRAQHAMYVIGDAETCRRIPMWAQVQDLLRISGNIGRALELQCPRHPDTVVSVVSPDDFLTASPDGGCGLRCADRLECGHGCPHRCHSRHLHDAVRCLEECPRRVGDFEKCDHPCPNRCGDKCPSRCTATVDGRGISLRCGHSLNEVSCWLSRNWDEIVCRTLVEKVVPGCAHKTQVSCSTKTWSSDFKCPEVCREKLECGHFCSRPCFRCVVKDNGDVIRQDHGQCQRKCGRAFNTCPHQCETPCHGDDACPSCDKACGIACTHSRCGKRCSEPCTPCAEANCTSACQHTACSQPCATPCDLVPCALRCTKILECGHQCPSMCGEVCPTATHCHICASDEIKNTRVDLLMMANYREIDIDETPCIFLLCGHFFVTETLDGIVNMKAYYELDDEGRPIAVKNLPFKLDVDISKLVCPDCRNSLRGVSRYGRPIRSALLIQSTLRFITWSNAQYVKLYQTFFTATESLQDTAAEASLASGDIDLGGPGDKIVNTICSSPGAKDRYQSFYRLYSQLSKYMKQVRLSEQPFRKVQDMVHFASRQREAIKAQPFNYDAGAVLQTKAFQQASCLLLRCVLTLLLDYFRVRSHSLDDALALKALDLAALRADCDAIATTAAASQHVGVAAEAALLWVHFAALELIVTASDHAPTGAMTRLRTAAEQRLEHTATLRRADLAQTCPLADDVARAAQMLREGTWLAEMPSTALRAVVAAMATEFSGTGHWYRCMNGHPFTVGECGMPMEMARCPACGAPIGGQSHVPAAGVLHDATMNALAGLRI